MSMYQPLIPTGSVGLNLDYQNIQKNFQQLDTTFGIDHTTFSNGTSNNGYHKVVHLMAQSGTPGAVAGSGELYTRTINDNINTDTELFYQTAGGLVIPLTRNFEPRPQSRGFTMLPGGLILQWGQISASSGSATVTFSDSPGMAFPSSCYNVTAQLFYTGSAPTGRATIAVKLNTNVSFTYVLLNPDGASYNGFFWTAIGK